LHWKLEPGLRINTTEDYVAHLNGGNEKGNRSKAMASERKGNGK
jgi:hypothetical protein